MSISWNDFWNKIGNTFSNLSNKSKWDDYHKNGIIPNLWAGFTGQKSAEMQTEQNIQSSEKLYQLENDWQRDKYASELAWQREQFGSQMDFANRQLNANIDVANKNFDLQQQAFDYQKQLNSTQMEREDNAIQRQVADFAKAGFSPLAAIGGSGSGSSPLSAGSAPQMDYSGVNAAAGQYADFARQYASLHQQATQSYMNNRSSAARAHNSDILGARMALSQMKSDMHYKGQNMATQYFNTAVNARNQLLQNDYLREQISNLKDEHDWNNIHGYRGETLDQTLLAGIKYVANSETFKKIADNLGVSATAFSKAVDKWIEHSNQPISQGLKEDLGNDSYNSLESASKKEFGKSVDELSPTELIKLADTVTPENEKLGHKVKNFFINLYYKGRSLIGK